MSQDDLLGEVNVTAWESGRPRRIFRSRTWSFAKGCCCGWHSRAAVQVVDNGGELSVPRLCRYWWERPQIIASEVASVASSVHKCSRQVVAPSASASVLVVGLIPPRLEGGGAPANMYTGNLSTKQKAPSSCWVTCYLFKINHLMHSTKVVIVVLSSQIVLMKRGQGMELEKWPHMNADQQDELVVLPRKRK